MRKLATTGSALLALTALALVLTQQPALAHSEAFDVVVEAVGFDADDPGRLAYGVVLIFTDGDLFTGAAVTVTATNGPDSIVVSAVETVDGVYTTSVGFPHPGDWIVRIDIEGESNGSVGFVEAVSDSPIATPVVRVDTARPHRQGLEVGDESAVFGTISEPGAQARLDDLRVESLVRDAVAPLRIDYGVSTLGASTVVLTGRTESGLSLGPVALESVATDVFQGRVEFPDGGVWSIEVLVDGSAAATFSENLPWPHYSTEAGFPKIKVATANPSLEGTLTTLEASPIFAIETVPNEPPAEERISPSVTEGRPTPSPSDVTIDLPNNAQELGLQVTLRWLHLAALGLWVLALVALFGRWPSPAWKPAAVVGSIATIASGVGLALWGAPTAYPGIIRWSELGRRLYGSAYETAFTVKMGFVAVSLGATALLVARSTRARFLVAVGSMGGAAAVVVAISQFHLWAHL